MRRTRSTQLVPNCDAGDTDTSAQLVSSFVAALAREGVPEVGARAVLRRLRTIAAATRAGTLSPDRALLKILQTCDAARRRARELERLRIKKLAAEVKASGYDWDVLADVRQRLRGVA